MRTSIARVIAAATLVTLSQPVIAQAAVPISGAATAGRLDRAFGQGGFSVVPRSTYSVNDVRQAPDGSILVAVDFAGAGGGIGGFAVERLTAAGAIDQSFGDHGAAVAPFTNGFNVALSTAVQSDGKIVAVGSGQALPAGQPTMAIARFTHNGVLDPTFGSGGRLMPTIPGSTAGGAGAVLQLPSGELLVGGAATIGGTQLGVVIRLHRNGAFDAAFGSGGIAFTKQTQPTNGLGLQSDGKIVVLQGSVASRLLPDGSPDPDASRGTLVVETHHGPSMLTTDEHIILAEGLFEQGSRSDIDAQAIRLFPDGSVDQSFQNPLFDFVQLSQDDAAQIPEAVLQQADGKVVVAGEGVNASGSDEFALARLTSSGAFDLRFGRNGIEVDALDANDQLLALGVQSNGEILAAGLSFTAVGMIVARYLTR